MAKKYFQYPFVLLSDSPLNPGTGEDGEDGSGQDTPHGTPNACSFDEWMSAYHVDMNRDGRVDEEDYRRWWVEKGLSADAWNAFNPGKDLH